jgi:hypothetical protein
VPRVVQRCVSFAVLLALAAHLSFPSAATAASPPGALDARAWELVSPLEKGGGSVGAPGSEAAEVLQAASGGGALAFGSVFSFGDAEGALPVNQYIARRSPGGWFSENLTPAALSGTYAAGAYQLFSEDLQRAVVTGGDRCRDGSLSCEAEGPPLGAGGPAGYRNLYLREGNAYAPLITTTNFPALPAEPQDFRPAVEGASPDLRHVVFAAEGALYEWSEGAISDLDSPAGSALADGQGAVSQDGSHVYFAQAGDLYLRQAGQTKLVASDAEFQGAPGDGSLAFYLKASHLYSYAPSGEQSTDLTPSGGAVALLGASDDGATIFYVAFDGLYRRQGTSLRRLIPIAPASLPPASGSARVSADGARLFFDSPAALSGKDTNAAADVYEWEGNGTGSCSLAGGCLGLISSGFGAASALAGASATGEDAFFATAAPLLPRDADAALDLYDARAGGGLPEEDAQTCLGDDCQGPAPAPVYVPAPTESLLARSNPPVRFAVKKGKKNQKGKRKHKGRKGHKGKHRHKRGRGR